MLKTFTKKMDLIKEQVEDVFSRLIKASSIALTALSKEDASKLAESKKHLKNIDELCDEIDNNVIAVLALFSPEAKDLRILVSYLKITSTLHKSAQNIRSYNKVAAKSFEDFEQYFKENTALATLQKASFNALKISLEILKESDEKILEELYQNITKRVDETEDAYEVIEKEILGNISKDSFEAQMALLKTFRKLDKITNRAFDISSTLLCAKLNHLPLQS
jgi:phosphate transport system protein